MIHLDTTLLVDLLREERSAREEEASASRGGEIARIAPAHRFLQKHADEAMGASVYVACELLAGAECATNPDRERAAVRKLLDGVTVVYPDQRFASTYAELFAELRRRGEAVAAFDLLIGTAARVDDVPLVTRNTADFERIPGLHVLSY